MMNELKSDHERWLQRNILLPEESEDEGGEGGEGGGRWILPEQEYHDIYEQIRTKHKGRVDPARKFHERNTHNNAQTAAFANDTHPLLAKPYFAGIDDKEIPLAESIDDPDIRERLENKKRLEHQKRLGLAAQASHTPRPRMI